MASVQGFNFANALASLSQSAKNALNPLSLLRFLRYSALTKPHISLTQPANQPESVTPIILPNSVSQFLSKSCQLSSDLVLELWKAFGGFIWANDNDILADDYLAFMSYGISHGIRAYSLVSRTAAVN
jgi:hypothetical protein